MNWRMPILTPSGMYYLLVSGTETEILSESEGGLGITLGAGVVMALDESRPSVARKEQRIL